MAKQKISIVRGTTEYYAVSVIGSEGEPYELQTGEILRFGVKSRTDAPTYIIKKELTSEDADEDGEYPIKLEPSDTQNLPFGTYYYDIGLQSGDDYFSVIEASEFIVAKNITSWEAVNT